MAVDLHERVDKIELRTDTLESVLGTFIVARDPSIRKEFDVIAVSRTISFSMKPNPRRAYIT